MIPLSTVSHLESVRKCWQQISDLRSGSQQVTIGGSGLGLPVLVAVARCVRTLPGPLLLLDRPLDTKSPPSSAVMRLLDVMLTTL
jgi:hypothetical protein